jgi:hypothetical protein
MNRLTAFCLLAACSFATFAASPSEEAADRLLAVSLKQEVAANDPRVTQTRLWLDKAAKLAGEEPTAIAYACSRYAGHLHDAAQVEATPLELLEALTRFGKAGKPMRDTLQEYATARKAVPGRSHADTLVALTAPARK